MANEIAPRSDESQAQFVRRFHKLMAGKIPNTDQRNAEAFRKWREARGGTDQLERLAREKFGNKRFVKVPDVRVFTEHSTKDRDGNPVVYDRRALEKIAARCNERILDTGDFAPVTLGHTPTEDQLATGMEMPDIGGFAGNFRVGLHGNKTPRWAIFADEYHFAEDASKLQKRPRRSVELWDEERLEDAFFDPIAALGAETPRLDLGMAYAKRPGRDGAMVRKYAARYCTNSSKYAMGAVPCAPGAAAVSPKKQIGEPKKNAADVGAPPAQPAGATNPAAGGTGLSLTPDDARMIIDGIEQLPWVQWVKGKMEAEENGSGSSGSPSDSSGSSGTPSGGSGSGSPSGSPSDFGGSGSGSPSDSSGDFGSPSGSPSHYAAGDDISGAPSGESDQSSVTPADKKYGAGFGDDDGDQSDKNAPSGIPDKNKKGKKYASGTAEGDPISTGGQTVEGKPVNTTGATVANANLMRLARKSDSKSRYRKMEKRIEAVEAENRELRKRERDAVRFSRLSELKSEGYVFEIAEELEDTAGLTDEQFDRHCKRVATRYSRAPIGETPLFVPRHIPGDDKKTPDKYARALGDRVKKIHDRNIKAGRQQSYSEVQAAAEAELRGEGVTKTA